MVVFYHLGKTNLGGFENGAYQLTFDRVFTNISAACVPLFFMVNGALMLNKQYTVERIYAKAAKIALLLFVWNFTEFPSWFFKTLIVIYLLYPLLKKIYDNKKFRYLLMFAVLVMPFVYNMIMTFMLCLNIDFHLNILGHEISRSTFPQKTGVFTMYSLLYFFLGAEFKDKKVNPFVSFVCAGIGLTILTTEAVFCANASGELQDSVNGYFPTVGALILTLGLFNFFKVFDKKSFIPKNVIAFLGKHILAVYLFHMMFIKLIRKFILTGEQYSSIVTLLVSVLIFAACVCLSLIIEKIPLVNKLVKI